MVGQPYVRVELDASGACTLSVITSPLTSPREPESGTPAPLTSGLSIPTAEEVQAADAEDMKSAENASEFQVLPTPPGLNHTAANGVEGLSLLFGVVSRSIIAQCHTCQGHAFIASHHMHE